MTATTYTFHRASDHAILATAEPATLQTVAERIATAISRDDDNTKRRHIYVHNGKGIIAAGVCFGGRWHDVERGDYTTYDTITREQRAAAGYPND